VLGILLENLKADNNNRDIINSDFFLGPKDNYKSNGLVAFSEPIFSIGSDGKKVVNFFLDIWGQFKDEFDPTYILLAGLGAAISSTVLFICDGQIMVNNIALIK
jgi:hypothetical protein